MKESRRGLFNDIISPKVSDMKKSNRVCAEPRVHIRKSATAEIFGIPTVSGQVII